MCIVHPRVIHMQSHDGLCLKNNAMNTRDLCLIPGSRRSPEEGNNYTLQSSGLENSMDRGAWQDCKESDTTGQLSLTLIGNIRHSDQKKSITRYTRIWA